MRAFYLSALAPLLLFANPAQSDECLRPQWGECVSFPNGGRHTGVSIKKEKVETEVTPGPEICVDNQEEIGGYTFARFKRDGKAWPDASWGVNIDDFCFYRK